MIPTVIPLTNALLVDWSNFTPSADHEFYKVVYGLTNPPTIVWGNTTAQQITISGLTAGVTYYVQVFAFDCFGGGQGSGIASGTPLDTTNCAPCRAGKTSIVQTVSRVLTIDYQDILSVTAVLTQVGQFVSLWAGGDFAYTSAGVGRFLVQRRVSGGGGVTVDLRSSGVYVPSTNDPVTGHISLSDAPDPGTWEYVLMAKCTVPATVLTASYIDLLQER